MESEIGLVSKWKKVLLGFIVLNADLFITITMQEKMDLMTSLLIGTILEFTCHRIKNELILTISFQGGNQ